jgi:hypothetical protein
MRASEGVLYFWEAFYTVTIEKTREFSDETHDKIDFDHSSFGCNG